MVEADAGGDNKANGWKQMKDLDSNRSTTNAEKDGLYGLSMLGQELMKRER